MGCSGCQHRSSVKVETKPTNTPLPPPQAVSVSPSDPMAFAPASADPTVKVHLRYNGGGGTSRATGSGCRTCHGSTKNYSTITNEMISFVSLDSMGGCLKASSLLAMITM